MEQIDKAWNDSKEYLDIGPAVDKAVEQCSKVTGKTGEQIAEEAAKVAKDLDVSDWISSSSLSEYELRAAEEIKKIQEYNYLSAATKAKKVKKIDHEQSLD